ncbi:TetR/AcrR family transcriptional regulator C-terminal domain-containing protein [Kineococcus sp. SYSU DK003]|uniref:TetR/AcrR family transcriptional regulator C-terminal domain-containing protein n=1 Tax=Kineococcus sp. SYSU DK003 TaxID=3383124 RepID=UPI003D7CF006
MVDLVNAGSPDLDQVEGDWRARLEVAAREEYELPHRHPWVLGIPWTRGPLGPHSLTAFESALRAVAGTGLDDAHRVQVVTAVMRYVRGAARESADARSSFECGLARLLDGVARLVERS